MAAGRLAEGKRRSAKLKKTGGNLFLISIRGLQNLTRDLKAGLEVSVSEELYDEVIGWFYLIFYEEVAIIKPITESELLKMDGT